jgi:hypothetical protein
MQRAGLATARLALALAPHARTIWIACGPGNNGGDGLEAAMHLRRWGLEPVGHLARRARGQRTRADAHACVAGAPHEAQAWHFADHAACEALGPDGTCASTPCWGIGAATRAPTGRMADWLARPCRRGPAPAAVRSICRPGWMRTPVWHLPVAPETIAVDGAVSTLAGGQKHLESPPAVVQTPSVPAQPCKPGSVHRRRGATPAAQLWFDDLGIGDPGSAEPRLWLDRRHPAPASTAPARHATRGSFGDVAIVGGEGLNRARHGHDRRGACWPRPPRCTAAPAACWCARWTAARMALDPGPARTDVPHASPALAPALEALTVVCGCGGGEAVRAGAAARCCAAATAPGAGRRRAERHRRGRLDWQPLLVQMRATPPARPACSRPTRWKPRACWAPAHAAPCRQAAWHAVRRRRWPSWLSGHRWC